MSDNLSAKVIINLDNFTFYGKSGIVYLTAKTIEPYIAENKIVLDKNVPLQIKFSPLTESFTPTKIFASKYLEVELDGEPETCNVRGIDTKRWSSVKFCRYANNFRDISSK